MDINQWNIEAIKKSHDYYYECYEKDHLIPSWLFYVLGFIGFISGFYIPFAFVLIVISIYQLAKREGKREGFIDGFAERGDIDASFFVERKPVIEQMENTIKFCKKRN